MREDLDRTEHQPEDYWAAQEARTRLAAEVAGLEDIVAELEGARRSLRKEVEVAAPVGAASRDRGETSGDARRREFS